MTTSRGRRRGRRRIARQSRPGRVRRGGVRRRRPARCWPSATRRIGIEHQQRRRVPRPDRRACEAADELGAERGRRADGLQARRRADVRALAGQAPGPAPAGPAGRRAVRRFETVTFEWIPRERTSTPTGSPTRRWTRGRSSRRRAAEEPVRSQSGPPGRGSDGRGGVGAASGRTPTRLVLVRHGSTVHARPPLLRPQRPCAGRGRPGPGRRAGPAGLVRAAAVVSSPLRAPVRRRPPIG